MLEFGSLRLLCNKVCLTAGAGGVGTDAKLLVGGEVMYNKVLMTAAVVRDTTKLSV
jgi:hypothetical protein